MATKAYNLKMAAACWRIATDLDHTNPDRLEYGTLSETYRSRTQTTSGRYRVPQWIIRILAARIDRPLPRDRWNTNEEGNSLHTQNT